jgi:zinc protease
VLDAYSVSDAAATLRLLIESERQFLAFGFTQAEVDRSVAILRDNAKRSIATARTTPSAQIAYEILSSLSSGRVILSPEAQLALFDDATNDLSAADANAVLQASLAVQERRILFIGATPPPGGVAALKAAADTADHALLTAYVPPSIKPWPYTDFGAPSAVVERHELAETGVTTVRFANNVRLSIKPSTAESNRIRVRVRFGHGQLDLPRDRVDAADMAIGLLQWGGLRDLTFDERNRTLMGRGVIALTRLGEDAFELSNQGMSSAADLDLQLQLMTAYVVAPGWRPEQWTNVLDAERVAEEAAQAAPLPLLNFLSPAMLHGGVPRWARSTAAQRETWRPVEARAFLEPIL